jgi:hypothetical protein
MQVFMESGDVARELGLVAATVRLAIRMGDLKPFAETCRGSRLFRRKEFEAFRKLRKARKEQLLRRVAI